MSAIKPVIVFVPGAFLGAGPYASFAKTLRAKGYTVDVVTLPSAGDLSSETPSSPKWKDLASKTVESDVQAIQEVLLPYFEQGERVVIVGHSYGSIPAMLSIQGQTLEERTANNLEGGIVGYINIAGFTFGARGKNTMGTEDDPPPMPYHHFQNGIVTLQEIAKPIFFSDLSSEGQDAIWSTFPKHQSWACFLCRPTFIDADVKIPKAYIKTERDECVFPAWQNGFVMAGQFDVVVSLSTGHCPMASAPEELTRVIDQFVIQSTG
ncbi:hypothetical protein FSARC_1186 [Fusarium sarcochroum]|uniref:AB hydrolase-1 domain-containing protein n=1 Tax=Fusarium sarcochroum TaxID=1208366 RepID=A0A8H4U9Y1_9HYPO|nr:hypothetical protein FSARC_1186 [Fusarium sarcochroum]